LVDVVIFRNIPTMIFDIYIKNSCFLSKNTIKYYGLLFFNYCAGVAQNKLEHIE